MSKGRMKLRDRRRPGKQNRDDRFISRCTSKKRLTADEAPRAARFLELRTGQKAQAYHCRYGDHWHVGRVRRQLADGAVIIEKAGTVFGDYGGVND